MSGRQDARMTQLFGRHKMPGLHRCLEGRMSGRQEPLVHRGRRAAAPHRPALIAHAMSAPFPPLLRFSPCCALYMHMLVAIEARFDMCMDMGMPIASEVLRRED